MAIRPEPRNADEEWFSFWQPLLEREVGVPIRAKTFGAPMAYIDTRLLTKLKLELCDYGSMMSNASEVFMEVSGGKISKPHTLASEVIGEAEEHTQEAITEAVKDFLEANEDDFEHTDGGYRDGVDAIFALLREQFNIIEEEQH